MVRYVLDPVPVPGSELLRALEFPVMSSIKRSCVTLMKRLSEGTERMGLVPNGTNHRTVGLEFSVPTPLSWERKGIGY